MSIGAPSSEAGANPSLVEFAIQPTVHPDLFPAILGLHLPV
jgi:hypothetical protein